jgi:hypothetical protein
MAHITCARTHAHTHKHTHTCISIHIYAYAKCLFLATIMQRPLLWYTIHTCIYKIHICVYVKGWYTFSSSNSIGGGLSPGKYVYISTFKHSHTNIHAYIHVSEFTYTHMQNTSSWLPSCMAGTLSRAPTPSEGGSPLSLWLIFPALF